MAAFDDFKFNVGDLVRHRSHEFNSLLVQEECLVGVITFRLLHQEGETLTLLKTYGVKTISGMTPLTAEVELELVKAFSAD